MQKIRVDAGAGHIKFACLNCANNIIDKFPTSIKKVDKISTIADGRGFAYNNNRYLVGRLSDKTEDTNSFNFWVENLPLLLFKVFKICKVKFDQKIEIELSVNNLFKDRKEELKEAIKSFKINEIDIKISKVDIYLQGEGFYHSYIKEFGELAGDIVIDDLGYFSDDFCFFEDGEMIEAISNKTNSINKLIRKVKPVLESRLDTHFTDQQANEILVTRKTLDEGKIVELDTIDTSINKILDNLEKEYAMEYREHLKKEYLHYLKRANKIIICGGGANIIKRSGLPIPNAVVFGNVFGNVTW